MRIILIAILFCSALQAQPQHVAGYFSLEGYHDLGFESPSYGAGGGFAVKLNPRLVLKGSAGFSAADKIEPGDGSEVRFKAAVNTYVVGGWYISPGVNVANISATGIEKTATYLSSETGYNFSDYIIPYFRYSWDVTTRNKGSGPEFGCQFFILMGRSWGVKFEPSFGVLYFNQGGEQLDGAYPSAKFGAYWRF